MESANTFEREYNQQKEINAALRGENTRMNEEIHRTSRRESNTILIIGLLALALVFSSFSSFRSHSQVGKLQDAVDSSYEDGYSSGRSDGYSEGYDEGYSDCEDELRREYDAQVEAQYEEGYEDGYLAALSRFGLYD